MSRPTHLEVRRPYRRVLAPSASAPRRKFSLMSASSPPVKPKRRIHPRDRCRFQSGRRTPEFQRLPCARGLRGSSARQLGQRQSRACRRRVPGRMLTASCWRAYRRAFPATGLFRNRHERHTQPSSVSPMLEVSSARVSGVELLLGSGCAGGAVRAWVTYASRAPDAYGPSRVVASPERWTCAGDPRIRSSGRRLRPRTSSGSQ